MKHPHIRRTPPPCSNRKKGRDEVDESAAAMEFTTMMAAAKRGVLNTHEHNARPVARLIGKSHGTPAGASAGEKRRRQQRATTIGGQTVVDGAMVRIRCRTLTEFVRPSMDQNGYCSVKLLS